MSFAKLLSVLSIILAVASGQGVPSKESNLRKSRELSWSQDPTIAEIVEESDVHTTLEVALRSTGLFHLLDTHAWWLGSHGKKTLFAPTDQAFENLPEGTLDFLLANPRYLQDVLLYHVASGKYLSTDLKDGQEIQTLLDGGVLEDGGVVTVTIDGSVVKINQATVTGADLPAKNGVVHVIDDVLVPPFLQTSIADAVAALDTTFSTLNLLLETAGLVDVLSKANPDSEDGLFTVFAPTNDAFAKLPDAITNYLLSAEGKEDLQTILLYHVLDGGVFKDQLQDGASVTTKAGEDVEININGNSKWRFWDWGKVVKINDSRVVIADVKLSNGVVHVIDSVLVPPSLVDKIAGLLE